MKDMTVFSAAEAAGGTARAAEGLIPPGVPESEEGDFRATGGTLRDNAPEKRGRDAGEARGRMVVAG